MAKTQPTFVSIGVGNRPQLKMVFLGSPQVSLEGQVLGFRTRKSLALLIYLALEPGIHPRDKLCALFWPESDYSQGRVSLRSAITHLNKTLGGRWLKTQRDTLSLEGSQLFDLDTKALESAFKHAGQQGLDPTPLETASKLYRGEFLEGFSLADTPQFDDWVVAQRELARQWLDTVLERLCQLQADSGRLHLALETALRRMHLEVLNEAAHRQIIELQLKLGNQKAALEAYQYCKTVLERELGLTPSPQTETLLTQLGKTPKEVLPKGQTVEKQPPESVLPHQTRLVGREEALAQIAVGWAEGHSIFIAGEAGVGKTRFVQEFLASKSGQTVYRSARPGEAKVPYASLAETLRQLLRTLPNLSLEPWVRQELSRILPELDAPNPGSLSREADKLRFFDAIAKVVAQSLTQVETLILDDLQFFDQASLEALLYLNSKLRDFHEPSNPQHLIYLYRPTEIPTLLAEEIQVLLEREMLVLIKLEPLEATQVRTMLGDLLPQNSNLDQLGHALHRFTGGNPMFVLETVRSLAQRGNLDALTAERFEVRRRLAGLSRSPKVTAVISRRLERLSPAAKDLSRIAAIMGEQFSLERAAKVLRTDFLQFVPACEELETSQVWRGQEFSHDLLYEATLENIPQMLKPILHGQVLDALEDLDLPPSVLARHAIAAGREEASFRYSYQAGMDAFKLYTLPEAVEHLERVRMVGKANPELWKLLTESERFNLYDALLACWRNDGLHQPERSEPVGTELAEFAREVEENDLRRKIAVSLAFFQYPKTFDFQPILEALIPQLEHARDTQNLSQEYEALDGLMEIHFIHNKHSESLDYGTQALELAYKLKDRTKIADCLEMIGTQYWCLGDWSQASARFEEAKLYLSDEDPDSTNLNVTTVLSHMAWVLVHLGQARLAVPELRKVIEIRHQLQTHGPIIVTRSRLITCLLQVGEYGEAYTLNVQQQKDVRPGTLTQSSRTPGALVCLKLGRFDEARAILRACL